MADNTINGTSGDDIIETPNNSLDNEVNAGDGNDFIVDGGTSGANDILNGEGGDDDILGGGGNDTIDGGTGNDNVTGSEGDDTFLLYDNFGIDSIDGGGFSEITGDVLDASGMTTDATLTFGVDIAVSDGGGGPPGGGGGPPGGGDGGGPGEDPDAGGTSVTGATLGSGANLAEILNIESYQLGSGNDTVIDDGGDNIVHMGDGDDQFQITEGFGADTVTGGEGGETLGDMIDGSALTSAATVSFTGDGVGTVSDGVNTLSFTEIERVETGAGNDTIFGGTGAESVDGNDGDDVFFFGDNFGDDSYRGGEGTETTGDTLDGAALTGDVVVTYSGDGAGTLGDGTSTMSFAEMETLITGQGDDSVTGGSGNDTVFTNQGDDTFAVLDNFGTDTVDGGADGETNGDTLDGSGLTTDAIVDFTASDSGTLTSGANTANFTDFEFVETGAGNDTINHAGFDHTVSTNEGDDTFVVADGFGADVWDAGEGGEITGDVLDAQALTAATTVTFNNDGSGTLTDGADTVSFQDVERVNTGDLNDTITGSTGDEGASTGGGDDTVILADNFGNDDYVAGETGETNGDRLDGTALTSGVTVTLTDAESGTMSDGVDTLTFAEFELIETGAGNDTIVGSSEADSIATNDGDDRFVLQDGFGADTISLGEGGETSGDSLDGSALTLDTTVNFLGAEEGTLSAGADIASFEDVETLSTGSGNDTIISGSGNDSVSTNAGDDTFTLTSGFGTDTFNAGEGGETTGDRLDASALTGNTTVNLTTDGTGTLTQGADSVTFSDVERIDTGFGDDTIFGGTGADSIATGSGDDTVFITDGFGADSLSGQGGNDRLDGSGLTANTTVMLTSGGTGTLNDGTDTATFDSFEEVATGAGDDIVIGSSGADTVEMGQGDDRFVINDGFGNDSVDAGEGGQNGGGDTIDASALTSAVTVNFTSGESGNLTDGSDTLAFSGVENIETGAGNDTIISGSAGDNAITNGGDDTFVVGSGFGDDTFVAGETGETNGDRVDGTALTSDAFVTFTGSEQGTLTQGGNTLTFSEVETLATGSGNDTITSGAGNDSVSTNDGDDTFAIADGFGDDSFDGGAGGEFDGDAVDGTTLTGDATVLFTGDQQGTLSADGDTLSFTNVEGVVTGSGDDTFISGTGDDIVLASEGDDTFSISGAFGVDAFLGGEGGETDGDTLDASALTGDVTVSFKDAVEGTLSAGADAVQFFDVENIVTGSGNDTIISSVGDDSVVTNGGDDTFVVANNFGDDSFTAGETGETNGDRIDASAVTSGVTVTFTDAEQGTLTQSGNTLDFSEVEAVETGSGADTIIGSAGNETVVTNDGNDRLIISDTFGNDSIDGGSGTDRIDASAVSTNIAVALTADNTGTLTTGTDSVTFEGVEIIETGSGDDTITGSSGDDSILAGAGDDRLILAEGFGDDTFNAGAGGEADGDTLDGSALTSNTNVQINSGGAGTLTSGTDSVAFSNVEKIDTGDGNDTVVGSTGNDTVVTNAGDDSFNLDDGFGTDIWIAGSGNDTLDASSVAANTDVDFSSPGTGTLTAGSNTASFTGVENVRTGGGDDSFVGSADDESISAGQGDDTLVLSDGFGNDVFNAGEGGFTSGDDVDASALTGNVEVTFTGDESGTMTVGSDALTFTDVERITTGSGDDRIFGGDNEDSVSTGAGNDRIYGGEGSDTFDAGAGDDRIYVANGDSVDGGAGDDTFYVEDYFESGNATITIDGGTESTSAGDVLRLGRLADMSTVDKTPLANGNKSGSITLRDGTIINYSDIEDIICFTPGTMIATPYGSRDIAHLRVGHDVLTRDHGVQKIRWIQSRTVAAFDDFAPIRIRKGVMAGQSQDLLVSPQHRMLFEGYRAELLFGESEVLLSAKHLLDGSSVTQDVGGTVTYIHMMFDRHEVVYANGAASESFHPGAVGLNAVSDAAREELFTLFPELRSNPNGYGQTARRCLKRHETKLLSI